MSLRLNFNVASVRSQLSLQVADRLLKGSTERLSSGIRINRSADDPAGLAIANALRYQVQGLNTATENVENGVNLISTAEGAMDEVSTLLNRMRGLAVAAANEGAQDAPQLLALQRDLDESITSINRVADNTQFGSIKLLNGHMAGNTLDRTTLDSRNLRAVDYYQSLTQDYRLLQDGLIPGSTMEIGAPSNDLARSSLGVTLSAGSLSEDSLITASSQNGTALNTAAGQSTTIEGPLGSVTINIDADTTIGKVRDRINGSTALTGLRADFNETTGAFTIESTAFGAAEITVTSSADMSGGSGRGLFDSDISDPANNTYVNTAANQTLQLTYESRSGTQVITLTQDPTVEGGRGFQDPSGAFTLVMKDTSDGSMGSTISAPDIAYSAKRENPERIMLGPQQGQHTLLEIPDIHSAVLGQGNGSLDFRNLGELSSGNALTSGNAQQAIQVIDAAIEELSQTRGRLGALQASSLESTATYLRISSENLTASESRIRDVDFAKESAEFARQQALLQAATSMLAQANQTPNRVIQLLGQ